MDIVERLRQEIAGYTDGPIEAAEATMREAADEIERLRDALCYYADMGNYIKIGDVLTPIVRTIDGPVVDLGRTARAALGGNL